MQRRLKRLISSVNILLQDWLRYEVNVKRFKYLEIRNRMERLGKGPKSNSYVCLWPYTSRLTAVERWPFVGRSILRRSISDHEFRIDRPKLSSKRFDISVIIGHRGLQRKDLLLATLGSLGSQEGVDIEVIVVEQDNTPKIKTILPSWVRYVFQESKGGNDGYNRSAAFNLGAKHASGRILLLHDNDMLVPTLYCKEIVSLTHEGYDALNIKRYVFYLSEEDTKSVIESIMNLRLCTPLYIVQNLEAGGSLAITKDAYIKIGGMDESFIGWGGEDNEFWKRCSVLKRWIWGYTPVIHLWHESQPMKEIKDNINLERAKVLDKDDIHARIRKLRTENHMDTI
jgi:N-terminal domain of galactosyltransferase